MFKSELNEYCQKHGYNLPEYISTSSGPDHQLKWKCKLIIKDLDITFIGDRPSKKKIKAEQKIAEYALTYLKTNKSNNTKITDTKINNNKKINNTKSRNINNANNINNNINKINTKINIKSNIMSIYLIDLENIPLFDQELKNNGLYIGFHNAIHHSLPKYSDWEECYSMNLENIKSNKLLYTIEGGVKDLVDHYMTMFVWPLSLYLKKNSLIKTIYIISGDNAGFCTRICLEKSLAFNNVSNITIKNARSI
jgi:hypothetical protein